MASSTSDTTGGSNKSKQALSLAGICAVIVIIGIATGHDRLVEGGMIAFFVGLFVIW